MGKCGHAAGSGSLHRLIGHPAVIHGRAKEASSPESGEAVNNSAALETILVDKVMKLFVQWLLGKRARTGPLRMCIADRSTIITILSSGTGRAFIRNESSDEEPVRGL